MKIQHTPYHWVLVALALLALLLTFGDAHGQSAASAVFEGRPAMAGAQGGQGAQAGMPQGGLGVQGNDVAPLGKDVAPLRKDVTPARDRGVAKDQRSVTKKVSRAMKRTITRARHGTSEVDAHASASAP